MKLHSFALTPYPTPLLFFLITSLCTASRLEHLEQATKASLKFTNFSNSFHCKCFRTCHMPHQTAPFASIIWNLLQEKWFMLPDDSYGQQSNWCKLSIVQKQGFELSFHKQLLVILHRQTQLRHMFPHCNVIRNVWRALCVFRTGELPIVKKYPYKKKKGVEMC